MAIDFSKVVKFSNGLEVINCTPHSITFRDGEADVVVEPCQAKINARACEKVVSEAHGVQEVKTVFAQTVEGMGEIEEIREWATENSGRLFIVGSIISAQAYPGQVHAMTPAPGFERVPPAEKRMSVSKFTIF